MKSEPERTTRHPLHDSHTAATPPQHARTPDPHKTQVTTDRLAPHAARSSRCISSTRRSFAGPYAQSPDLLKRQFSRNLRTLDPRGKHTERTFVLIYPWYNTARARGLPARRRGRICAHMSMLEAGEGAAPARPLARPRHPRQRPLTSPPAASALRRLTDGALAALRCAAGASSQSSHHGLWAWMAGQDDRRNSPGWTNQVQSK